jgi:hypothetical protein
LQIVPTAVDSDALAIRRQDSATANLFRFFQDSSVAEGTGCAHLNTNNRSLAITASPAANTNDGIFINPTGRVGIGASAPGYNLELAGSNPTFGIRTSLQSASSASTILFRNKDGNGNDYDISKVVAASAGNGGYGELQFYTTFNNTLAQRAVIDREGRLGIGTTSPSSLLTLRQTTASHQIFEISRPNSDSSALLLGNDANSNALISANNADLLFGKEFAGTFTERMRIDSSGRLLVGTSTSRVSRLYYPSGDSALTSTEQIEGTGTGGSLLIVNNQAGTAGSSLVLGKSRGATTGSITAVASGDQLGTIQFNGIDVTTTGDLESCAGSIACEVDGTPGANDMPGRLVFSTTADGTSSPTERMRISQAGLSNFYGNLGVIYSRSGTSAGTAERVFIGFHSASSALTGTISINIYTNGNITNTNNSYGAISDLKLKENIVDATSQWSDIKALQVRKYNFKEETGQETHTQIGLVAQEAELVSPGLVSESPDRDEDGNDLGTVTKSVNYSVLYMKAVKALQEAMERIETLEAKVAALESA